MDTKECRLVRLEIDNSDLGQRLSERLESHVAGCSGCAQFRLERSELRGLVGSLKPVAAPADFEMRLRARIAREKDSRARQPFIFRFALSTPGIALAAGLVLMVAAAVWINQHRAPQTLTEVTANSGNDVPKEVPKEAPSTKQNSDDVIPGTKPSADAPVQVAKRTNPINRNAKSASENVSSDFGVGRAPAIGRISDREGEVSLTAPSQPMVVTVQDANGQSHKILLPPVSFGAQRFDSRTPVGMTNRKDW